MRTPKPADQLLRVLLALSLFGFCWLMGYIWGDYSGRRALLKECAAYKKSAQPPAKQGLQPWSQYSANRWPR